MASYTATFDHLYRDTNFGLYHARYYKITSTSTPPSLNTDFTVTFPSLTSSQYVSSTGDISYLGWGSSGTSYQYQMQNNEQGSEDVVGSWCPSIYGGTYSFRRVSFYDSVAGSTRYEYNLSSNYSSPPKIENLTIDASTVGTIVATCELNWGKLTSGTVDCTMSYTIDGTRHSYSVYTKKFTNGKNITMVPSSQSRWLNYTPTSLSQTYGFIMKIVDLYGTSYYKGTTRYWEDYPDGVDVTFTFTIRTSDGTDTRSVIQYVPMLWEIDIVDTEHQGGTTSGPDSVKGGGIKYPTGVVGEWRRFRLIG